jgi:hypothetical protein
MFFPVISYLSLIVAVSIGLLKFVQNNPKKARQILQFVTEFIGFCTVLGMFVTITVIMGTFFG